MRFPEQLENISLIYPPGDNLLLAFLLPNSVILGQVSFGAVWDRSCQQFTHLHGCGRCPPQVLIFGDDSSMPAIPNSNVLDRWTLLATY